MSYNIIYDFLHKNIDMGYCGLEEAMIKSMTGFGKYETSEEQRKVTVEMKAVNHRYLEMNIKLPKKLNSLESKIRTEIKRYVERGKIDVFITYEDFTQGIEEVTFNEDIAAQYISKFNHIHEKFNIQNDIKVSTLLRCPDVFSMEECKIDEEKLWNFIQDTVDKAAERLLQTRIDEGTNLQKDLVKKLNEMLGYVDFIEEKSPVIIEEYRKKIQDKVNEMLSDSQIDESRIAAETVLFADKICVDEETVRLRSHITRMIDSLSNESSVGRKLDFLAQEMNREANTILSKSNNMDITDKAIELKTEIEKVREQIQNIE